MRDTFRFGTAIVLYLQEKTHQGSPEADAARKPEIEFLLRRRGAFQAFL
jgi:hypothetical protein